MDHFVVSELTYRGVNLNFSPTDRLLKAYSETLSYSNFVNTATSLLLTDFYGRLKTGLTGFQYIFAEFRVPFFTIPYFVNEITAFSFSFRSAMQATFHTKCFSLFIRDAKRQLLYRYLTFPSLPVCNSLSPFISFLTLH